MEQCIEIIRRGFHLILSASIRVYPWFIVFWLQPEGSAGSSVVSNNLILSLSR
jgi:hypothetical protein